MPSFLSKVLVFGRKKSDDKDPASPRPVKRTSDSSLLDGKFESVSLSTPQFPEDVHPSDKGGDKGRPFGLLKPKSKTWSTPPTTNAPHLTLRLPGTTDRNGDSFVASFNPQAHESDDSISTRRLTPEEALSLIEACSKAITERGGLETLGVMRPHWHSASPQLQRKLVSLFILSLAHKSQDTTLAPSTSPLAAFNSELEYTRSVHDISAVFRWALRHLKLEGPSFGSSPSSNEWSWYNNFYESERKANYDPRVFTTNLVPEVPSPHSTLLLPILDLISSLAAHAEANGYSGSKLAKYFGFWLLTARRASETEDWHSFYMRWEVSGRMLEHLFLAWLRDENIKRPLPRRLQELVAQYPYTTSPDQAAEGLLTRPRFSTRRHDALFVRVEAIYADDVKIPFSRSPVGIFTDAFDSEPKSDSGGHIYLWEQVKATAASNSGDKPLPAVLSDDSINVLSLVSNDPREQTLLGISGAASTAISPLSPVTEAPLSPVANGNGAPPVRKPMFPSDIPQSPKNWAEFSSAGFEETAISQDFASTLLDKETEGAEIPVQRIPSQQTQRRSASTPIEPTPPVPSQKAVPEKSKGPKLVLVTADVVQLDEAFVDFWRDAVVDPISNDWPKFVVGELKHPLMPHSTFTSSGDGERVPHGSPINWIIVEEKFRRSTPPPAPVIPRDTLVVPAPPLKRTSSPRPSFGEKKSSSLSATLKRFTLFGSSRDDLTTDDAVPTTGGTGKKDSFSGKKRFGMGKSPKVGEMGEAVLSEEPEPIPNVTEKADEVEKRKGSGNLKVEAVAVAAGMAGGAVLTTMVGGNKEKTEAAEDGPTKEDTTANRHSSPALHQDDHSTGKPVPVTSTTEHDSSTSENLAIERPEEQVVATEPNVLPPVPESVVLHGETPGPQLALDSTEVGLHHVPDVEEPQGPATTLVGVSPAEPVIEHLEDKVEDPAADAGVDLDPVPIIPNDPIEVEEVEEPEAISEPTPAQSEPTPNPVAEEPEPPVTTEVETEKSAVEDVPATDVPSNETRAPVEGQESQTEAPPEDFSRLPSNVLTSEKLKEGAATRGPVPSEAEPTGVSLAPEPEIMAETPDVVAAEDVPPAQSASDVPASEPASQPIDVELDPPSEEPTEALEAD